MHTNICTWGNWGFIVSIEPQPQEKNYSESLHCFENWGPINYRVFISYLAPLCVCGRICIGHAWQPLQNMTRQTSSSQLHLNSSSPLSSENLMTLGCYWSPFYPSPLMTWFPPTPPSKSSCTALPSSMTSHVDLKANLYQYPVVSSPITCQTPF